MQTQRTSRRAFLGTTAIVGGAILGERLEAAAPVGPSIHIEEPFHGAVLNRRLGQPTAEGLKILVSGTAAEASRVTVQGQPAELRSGKFAADVILRDRETDITAVAEGHGGRQQDRVRVVWDRNSRPRYRFSIDDNSFFLRDVHQKGCRSLFDCFYLKMLRDLNRKYGAKFVLNIYFTTADGFDISQFSDRYKSEWRDNAAWLRLAFHAYADKPDRPYQQGPVEKLLADFDRVADQIRRFAPDAYSPPSVIHWGMVPPEAFQPLFQRGVRVLSGYFRPSNGGWDVNYRLDARRSEWLWHHDALKDFDSGIVFSRIDIVCNTVPLAKTAATLQEAVGDPNRAEIIDMFTHEQYFWPFYRNYLPDHPQRLDAAIRFVTERGYEPVFLHEGFLGIPAA